MAWSLTYNGFASWTNLTIETIRYEPVEEDDGRTTRILKGMLRGRGLLIGTNPANLALQIANARAAFETRGQAISISNGTVIFSQSANEGIDPAYPRGTVEINEITGVLTAVIAFEIEWLQFPASDENPTDEIVSHWWTQRFSIDEGGLSTWTVNGAIHISNAAANSNTGYPTDSVLLGSDPDHYRALVFPTLPTNFRVKSLDWAESSDGQHLVYTVVAMEHARPLPKPARRGSGSFTWRRAIESGDLLGVKSFDAELEGDAKSDRGELLAALLTVASNRIIFAGPNSDQILSIEITESDIFSKNRIGLRISARGAGNASGNPLELQPNFSLVSSIVSEDQHAEPMDPYGSALIRFVRRNLYLGDYTAADFPRAEFAQLDAPGATDPYAVTEGAVTSDFTATIDAGQLAGNDDPSPAGLEHQEAPYVHVVATERVVLRPHVIALKAQSLDAQDYPYQTESPDLILETEYQVTRQRKAPDHVMLDVPAGCILLEESFTVSPGEIDGNNNRSFRGVFRRRLQMLRTPVSGLNLVTDTVVLGGVSVRFQRLVPTNLRMGLPHDPRRETTSQARQRTAFEAPGNEPESLYSLAPTTVYEAS